MTQAYEMLSGVETRRNYNEQLQAALIDEMDDFTGRPLSKWLVNSKMGKNWDPNEERAVFVVLLLSVEVWPSYKQRRL